MSQNDKKPTTQTSDYSQTKDLPLRDLKDSVEDAMDEAGDKMEEACDKATDDNC